MRERGRNAGGAGLLFLLEPGALGGKDPVDQEEEALRFAVPIDHVQPVVSVAAVADQGLFGCSPKARSTAYSSPIEITVKAVAGVRPSPVRIELSKPMAAS